MSEGIDIPFTTPGGQQSADVLLRVADALDRTSQKAATAGRAMDTLRRAADTFNEVHAAAATLIGGVERMTSRVAELATEESNLAELSARMGLDFDRAAGAAGRFADETVAMGVAGRAAASDIRLTQTELDAVMRLAGSKAVELGTTVQGAAEMLTEALVRGREGGLQRFGAGLAELAGEGHTVQERLAGVVTEAHRTAAATDNAADRVLRYRDALEDAQRSAAAAFVTEAARLAAVSSAARGATTDADELKIKMQAVGQTAAYVLTQIGNVAQVVVGVVGMAMAPLLTSLDVAAAGIAALSSNGPAAAARAMAAAAQEGRASQAGRFALDGLRGFRDAYNASNDPRTTADSGPAATPAGGGAGRGSDMTFSGDEATQILGRRRGAGGGRNRAVEDSRAGARSMLQELTAQSAERRSLEERLSAEEDAARQRTRTMEVEAGRRQQAELNAQEDREAAARSSAKASANVEEARRFGSQLRALYAEQTSLAAATAQSIQASFNGVGEALSANVQLFVEGRATLGEALEGVAADSLKAISKQAYAKGAYFAAEALGMLAIGNFPGAGLAAASSVAFFAAGAATGAAGAALAPAKPAAAAAAATGSRNDSRALTSGPRGGNDSKGTVINVNFGGSTILGSGGARQVAREIAGVLNDGARQGGVTLSPQLMAGAR